MARATIGGIEYDIPEMNFVALERAWPHIEVAMVDPHPMRGPSAAIHIIASGLIEADNFKPENFGIEPATLDPYLEASDQICDRVAAYLKKKLKATEIGGLKATVDKMTEEAGLVPAEGEDQKGATPSMETSDRSSLNSLPLDAKEEAGTAFASTGH